MKKFFSVLLTVLGWLILLGCAAGLAGGIGTLAQSGSDPDTLKLVLLLAAGFLLGLILLLRKKLFRRREKPVAPPIHVYTAPKRKTPWKAIGITAGVLGCISCLMIVLSIREEKNDVPSPVIETERQAEAALAWIQVRGSYDFSREVTAEAPADLSHWVILRLPGFEEEEVPEVPESGLLIGWSEAYTWTGLAYKPTEITAEALREVDVAVVVRYGADTQKYIGSSTSSGGTIYTATQEYVILSYQNAATGEVFYDEFYDPYDFPEDSCDVPNETVSYEQLAAHVEDMLTAMGEGRLP